MSLFTCIACRVAFTTPDAQREHYRTDWHRYNLKRKMAGLDPVSADSFANKVASQQSDDQHQIEKTKVNTACGICRKSFSTENSYLNHLQSKKHKEVAKGAEVKQIVQKPSIDKIQLTQEQMIEKKQLNFCEIVADKHCLFCRHESDGLEQNVTHMITAHSFFIPDIEYLKDPRGLVDYLGRKVSVFVCLYCDKGFYDLEAVRKHMSDKGHSKMLYEGENDQLTFSDFYDFSASYPTEDDWVDVEEEINADVIVLGDERPAVYVNPDESELVLASGARIGHRSLARYYRQNLITPTESDAVMINRLLDVYYAQGYTNSLSYRAHLRNVKASQRQTRDFERSNREFMLGVGVRANRLQTYFREQVLF